MPISESTPQNNVLKLIFGVFSTYERNGWIQPSILQFFCDLPFRKDVAYRMIPVHNFVPCASGRNQLCKHSKDCKDVDWIVMIDNDMELRGDFLDTVKDAPADADIICPSFYMWNQSELNLALCWGLDSAPDGIATFGPGFHELTKCGTGAIFTKRMEGKRAPKTSSSALRRATLDSRFMAMRASMSGITNRLRSAGFGTGTTRLPRYKWKPTAGPVQNFLTSKTPNL